jgi:uncharacterized RDD family membrane protein YckC
VSTLPPAGWFDDPDRTGGLRYWDGAQWTDARHDAPPSQPTPTTATGAPAPKPALGLPAAGWWERAAAWFLDHLVCILLGVIAGLIAYAIAGDARFDEDTDDPLEYYAAWGIGIWALAELTYRWIWMGTHNGQTLGKAAVGIRVVHQDNAAPIGVGRAALRELLIKNLVWILPVGWLIDNLWPLWDKSQLALHDHMAGTRVVKARASGGPVPVDTNVQRDAFGNPL